MARSRSRSPPRQSRKSKGGFAWKESKPKEERTDESDRRRDADDYREDRREPKRDAERDHRRRRDDDDDSRDRRRDRHHDRDRRREREDDSRRRDRDERDGDEDRHRRRRDRQERVADDSIQDRGTASGQTTSNGVPPAPANNNSNSTDIASKFGMPASAGLDIASKFGTAAASKAASTPAAPPSTTPDPTAAAAAMAGKSSKPKKAKVAAPTGPMILVTVNDRLGTKAQIPCLASDSVADFKKIVAMKIGRRPHEILIKRQSERPFKDQLSLEDYGVSSGVQLDLELDTGD